MNNIELSLKELVIAVLYRWRLVLVFAVVIALVMAGFGYFTRINNMDALQNVYEKHITAWEQSLKAKQDTIESLTEKASAAKIYNQESLLMEIDPFNNQVATISLYAQTAQANDSPAPLDPEMQAATVKRLVDQYMVVAVNAPLETVFAGLLPREYREAYLREVIRVQKGLETDVSAAGYPPNESQGIITITIFGNKNYDAQDLALAMYQYLLSKKDLVTASAGEHTLSILGQSSVIREDQNLADIQTAQRNMAAESSNQITTLMDEISDLRAKKPSAPATFPYAVKNGIIGGLVGLFLGIVASILIYLAQLPLQAPEQLQNQLGIRFLGGTRRKYRGWPARWGARLAGSMLLADEGEAMKIIAANLKEAIGSHRSILLTGTLPESLIREFAEKLSGAFQHPDVTLTPVADINASAESIVKLSQADAVILVERLHVSGLRKVYQEKERLRLAGRDILGYALY